MVCAYREQCGGCPLRHLEAEAYREHKQKALASLLNRLPQENIPLGAPVFIGDGHRRRASMAFEYKKGRLVLGFNENKSANLVDVETCALLTGKINRNLPSLRRLLQELCAVSFSVKKGKKAVPARVEKGDVWICEADNGLDIVLEFNENLQLDHRMIIFESVQTFPDIIRVSHRRKNADVPETVVEKAKPVINIAGYDVFIPAGTFLQASKASEQALVSLVMKYAGDCTGKIADLFCGVGTFSYPLSKNKGCKILSVDSSEELLDGFKASVNRNRITNIEVIKKNLFKYPLDEKELEGTELVVFDPPRAGAAAQAAVLAGLPEDKKPRKIIAVSCNPYSFVKDAGILLAGGYKVAELTLVDQFSYSDHSELIALFTK